MTQPVCDDGDLERFAGAVIPDPWADPDQPDWPDNELPHAAGEGGGEDG